MLRPGRRDPEQVADVLAVGGEQQVELLEVARRDLAGCAGQREPTTRRRLAGARVRPGAGMPATGAGTVDLDPVLQTALDHQPAHDRFGGGRPADVAQADEQQAGRHAAIMPRG